jgi:hypothetical protein
VNGWPTRAWWSAFTLWHARDERKLPFKSLEQILQIQNRRVQSIVRHAYETVPHYREAMDDARLRPGDFRTAEDLTRLPLVTARDVARDRKRFRSTARKSQDSLYFAGSSGNSIAESGSHQTAASAKQSAIFAFSAENSKIGRVLAHFLRPVGTGEAEIRPSAADLCLILSVETRAGAPSHRPLGVTTLS